jgi:hypothetical protein
MDLSDIQRKLLFAGLVVVLAAAGIFLTISKHGNGGHTSHRSTPAAIASTQPPVVPTPTAVASPATPGQFDIYHLLPFTQQDFAAANNLAQQFMAAYGTYRYDQDPKTYAAGLANMTTAQLGAQLAQGASAPGLIQQRQKSQEVSVGTAIVMSIRDIQKDSIVFVVSEGQHITSTGKAANTSAEYAVTVQKAGGGWVVYAFEPASQGNS